MQRKYKLISFDLDDTLLKSDKTIPKETVDWIKKYRGDGGIVILASGRDITEMTDFMAQLGMNRGEKGYIISSSGAYLWCLQDDKIIEFESFSNEIAKKVIDALLEISDSNDPMIVCKKRDYVVKKRLSMKDKLREMAFHAKHIDKDIIEPHEILQISDHIEKIRIPYRKFTDYDSCLRDLNLVRHRLIEGKRVDFFYGDVDKATGISKVLELEGLSDQDLLLFGDDENDLTCFELFTNTVAMKNSVHRLLEIAKTITDTNEENGVLAYLNGNEI